jgi:hypothetical protein
MHTRSYSAATSAVKVLLPSPPSQWVLKDFLYRIPDAELAPERRRTEEAALLHTPQSTQLDTLPRVRWLLSPERDDLEPHFSWPLRGDRTSAVPETALPLSRRPYFVVVRSPGPTEAQSPGPTEVRSPGQRKFCLEIRLAFS